LFEICLRNDIPINIIDIAITKFSESLRRFDYSKTRKYFNKIFRIIDSDLHVSSVNALKIFMQLIKVIDFIKHFYNDDEE